MSAGTELRPYMRADTATVASPTDYLFAVLACALTTALASAVSAYFDLANIVMLFLLTVVLVAVRFGRGPAVLAAFLSVALFDFFFVPPTLSFTVHDVQYLVTFAVMLIVALITGQLTAGLRHQARAAAAKEARTRALYEVVRELLGAPSMTQAAGIVQRFLRDAIGAEAVIFMEDEAGKLKRTGDAATATLLAVDECMVDLAHAEGHYVNLDATPAIGYFPLKGTGRARGVLVLSFPSRDPSALQEHRALVETVVSLLIIVIERGNRELF